MSNMSKHSFSLVSLKKDKKNNGIKKEKKESCTPLPLCNNLTRSPYKIHVPNNYNMVAEVTVINRAPN